MGEGPLPEEERNVVPERDDERSEEKLTAEDFWGGSTHFHRYVNPANQRSYPDRSRGTVRD